MRKSRLREVKPRKLREHFVAGTTARTVARLVGVNKTTAAYYYQGSRLVKRMRKQYKGNDDKAKLVFPAVARFGEEISSFVAAVLSGSGSH